jgi:ATP-dependent DNA helicase RecG
VDFKAKPSGVKPEDIVALANARGGTILIGVEERHDARGRQGGIIIGCTVTDQDRQALVSMAGSCRPGIDIALRIENTRGSKPILRIDVAAGKAKPYCTSSGTYKIRVDGQNAAIDPALMKAIILESEASVFVSRFKAAADELLDAITRVHLDLTEQLERVELAADQATEAATAAEEAAIGAQMTAAS